MCLPQLSETCEYNKFTNLGIYCVFLNVNVKVDEYPDDSNEVMKLLNKHMENLIKYDFVFYILLAYHIHR